MALVVVHPWAKGAAISNNPAKMTRAIPERDVSRFTLKDAAYSFLMGALSPLLFVNLPPKIREDPHHILYSPVRIGL